MPLVSMRQLLDHAAENGYGIPAFNVNNLEQVQAVMTAAAEVGAPVILQASAGARKYAGEPFIKHLIQAATEAYPHIPLVMHQDHGTSPKVCQGAIDLGFGSVMMDGSLMEDGKTPASFDYNVQVTRKVVDMAHAVGVTVEGELGCLGNLETGDAGEEDGVGAVGKLSHAQMLTDPEEAATFVKATQPRQGDPPAHPEHAPGDARQLQRAAGVAGHHQPVRRGDEGNLRRAGQRDPGSHQARRAQDQHRHRHPAGDDGRGAQVHG
jgi:fructose-bisphosphate aldolase class II